MLRNLARNTHISTAHFLKNRLSHRLFLPFKIYIFLSCALSLLSLLLLFLGLCNQVVNLLTTEDFLQKAEIF